MADKLIGADALTRAIVDSPSDISGYNPVYCNGVAKRQIEILDIILNMNGTTEGEIRAKAIDEFITAYERYCEEHYGDVAEQEISDMKKVAEQIKGGVNNE